MPRIVGSTWVRISTLLLLAATVFMAARASGTAPKGSLFYASLCCGILSLIGAIHCFEPLYRGWMNAAEQVQRVVVVLVFGAFYLLLGPLFFLLSKTQKLLSSRGEHSDTYWIELPPEAVDEESLRRMG